MIVHLHEVKEWLKIDSSGEDALLNILIGSAEKYLKRATGIEFDETEEAAKLFCFVLIVDWYENREFNGKVSDSLRHTITSILLQLSYGSDPV